MSKTELQKKIVNLLDEKGPMERADIVNELETPRTTVYDNLKKLINRDDVIKYPVNNNKRGRPKVFFEKNN
jgi:predicted ArsR family transcriptional regulator